MGFCSRSTSCALSPASEPGVVCGLGFTLLGASVSCPGTRNAIPPATAAAVDVAVVAVAVAGKALAVPCTAVDSSDTEPAVSDGAVLLHTDDGTPPMLLTLPLESAPTLRGTEDDLG